MMDDAKRSNPAHGENDVQLSGNDASDGPYCLLPAAFCLLGVRQSTRRVMERAWLVRIEPERVEAVAVAISAARLPPTEWDERLHFRDGTWRTATWVLLLDTLNFCFWSSDQDPAARWRVAYQGEIYDGYWALAAALTKAVETDRPLWDAAYLGTMTESELADILAPVPGSPAIPLFPQRLANVRELGQCLLRDFPGETPAAALIAGADHSAAKLVETIVRLIPSFNDVATYDGQEVRFYKRAQILVADLHGAFAGEGLGRFTDLEVLTAFADYKVPQVLRRFGILDYDADLAARIGHRELIPAGSPAEIEIRAATIQACELLQQALARRGRQLRAFEIDWALWSAGQSLPPGTEPYHRTLTQFY